MAELKSRMQRSGYVNNLNGFGKGFGGGRSELVSRVERPIIGINARFHLEGGIDPFPTRLRSVSGKNLSYIPTVSAKNGEVCRYRLTKA